jgi:hypothetical protein
MGFHSLEWYALATAWNELEALYEAEVPGGQAPRLYNRMKQLEREATGK